MNSTNLIEVHDLVQTIGSQQILKGFNLTVPKGETLVLLGRSGGGKSVFLRNLIGLMRPISGSIRFQGQEISRLTERALEPIRTKIGMLFQDGALFDSMTVEENVAFPLYERGERNAQKVKDKVMESLRMVNLPGQEKKMPVNLSGGMRKRVALARAIITRPMCILYDEPTAGLDPIVSDSINKLIRHLQKKLQVTSIVVTHDMVSANHIADRVALLHEGKTHFMGSLEELKHSQDPVIRDFIEGRSDEEF